MMAQFGAGCNRVRDSAIDIVLTVIIFRKNGKEREEVEENRN